MIRFVLGALAALLFAAPAFAIEPFPAVFKTQTITDQRHRHCMSGSAAAGPAVVLLHGFGDTGDMWAPIAAKLVASHTVIVPDLRGMGLSAHPDTGYTKANEARDIAGVMDALKVQKADLVTHDIGNMVGYALAAQYPARITRWVVIDAPLPGIGTIWQAQLLNPKTWHFNFYGPDEERLVAGRERIYLDRFYNELSAHPGKDRRGAPAPIMRRSMPDRMRCMTPSSSSRPSRRTASTIALFCAKGKLTMPVLALGGGEILWHDHEGGAGRGGRQCQGRRGSRLRSLDHGRKSAGTDQAGAGFPEIEAQEPSFVL